MSSYPEIAGVYLPMLEEAVAFLRAAAQRADSRGDQYEFCAFSEIADFMIKIGNLLHSVDDEFE